MLLGAAVVALGVLAYFYYERRHEPVVTITGLLRRDSQGQWRRRHRGRQGQALKRATVASLPQRQDR